MQKVTKFFMCFLFCSISTLFSQNYETAFNSRAQKIINYVADDHKWDASGWYNCSPSDFGKYNWPIVVASLHKYGLQNTKGNQYLPHFNTNSCIQNRFHFNVVGEAFIFANYWNAPSVKSNVKDYLTAAWRRNDSYNLFTAEGTENHLAMTRTAAYIYAQIANDSFPTLFPDANQKLIELKSWLADWAKMLYTSGAGEWTSSTYFPFSINGWLALYDGAKDAEVKLIARAVLDYYAAEMALHYTQGITGGYESRNGSGFESVVSYGDYLSWLWFGDSPRKISFTSGSQINEAATAIYAAVSTYRPPMAIINLAAKKNMQNAMYYNSKGEYLLNNPSKIKQTFFVGKTYTLGAAYLPYGGFTGGDTQFQTWKFVGRVAPDTTTTTKTANIIVGYGGKEWNKARGRMPWDQLVHHKNVLIQMTKVPSNFSAIYTEISSKINTWKNSWATDFAKRFPGETKANPVNLSVDVLDASFSYMAVWKKNAIVSYETKNNIAYFSLDSNFVAIRSIAQSTPTVTTATDNYAVKDAVTKGQLCGLILEVGSKCDYPSLIAFQNAIEANTQLNISEIATNKILYTNLAGEVIEAQYNSNGTFTEPIFDWGYGPTTPQMSQKSPPFVQPQWPSGEGYGRIATWKVNNNLVDLNQNWSVYKGPNIVLNNRVLSVLDGSTDSLKVDFSGNLPQYKSGVSTIKIITDQSDDQINVYPNPTTQLVKIEIKSSFSGSITIDFVDLSGRSVYLKTDEKTQYKQIFTIPIAKKLKGMYLVKIRSGQQLSTKKLQIY
jgi:hypothetical protein